MGKVSPTAAAYAAAREAAVKGRLIGEAGETLLDLLRPPKAGPWPWVRARELRERIGLRRHEMNLLIFRLKVAGVVRVRGEQRMEVALTRSAVGLETDRTRPHVLDAMPASCVRVWEALVTHAGPDRRVRLSLRRIARTSGVSPTQCRRALRRMVGAKILAVDKVGNGTRPTTYCIRWGGVAGSHPTLPPATQRTLDALRDLGPDGRAHVRDLAARIGRTERQIRTHLSRLASAGLVELNRGEADLKEIRKSSVPPMSSYTPRETADFSPQDLGVDRLRSTRGPASVTGGSTPQLRTKKISDAQLGKIAAELRKQTRLLAWPPVGVTGALVKAMIGRLKRTRPALSYAEVPELCRYLVAALGEVSMTSADAIAADLAANVPPRRAYAIATAALRDAMAIVERARTPRPQDHPPTS